MAENSKWQSLGQKILSAARNELYLNLPFLDAALGALRLETGFDTPTLATDGQALYYSGTWLSARYERSRALVCRAYLHTVLHCLLRHLPKRRGRDGALWDLCCDIAVESILDGLDYPCLAAPVAVSRRQALYERLGGAEKALTAEAIYRHFRRERLSPYERATLVREFVQDDHSLWEQRQNQENEEQWQRAAQRVQTGMETLFSQNASGGQAVLEQLRVEAREKHDYRAFLQRFAVLGEELGVDADTFDYGYYAYGLRRYGNMPLIEPLETREARRIRDLVIAIDTSMSTSGELVRQFLSYTYTILKESESFFRTFRLRLLQCDDQLRADQLITNEEDLRESMEHFQLTGQSATDFRPVFDHVEALRRKGELRDLRGLLYFTDGLGVYPTRRPDYDTAFVMLAHQGFPERVPPWGIRVLLDEDDLDQEDPQPDTLSEEAQP
ncbi:vWA domain-containing protein [Intestinimonas butyriciproducens]|uniref:vWA domain-containing protein n=1 Tax=Intestinimonas butyriciproducens TaxID=1297617 RepID=UPI001959F28E|nr:VWA-like domain-containing protein [Intestinimonas butyriciproducens]MBM6975399.1 hypothetical protein [Intestinimonas butyriciproducens]